MLYFSFVQNIINMFQQTLSWPQNIQKFAVLAPITDVRNCWPSRGLIFSELKEAYQESLLEWKNCIYFAGRCLKKDQHREVFHENTKPRSLLCGLETGILKLLIYSPGTKLDIGEQIIIVTDA
ncbi:uncharacterized protein LOC111086829 isoform X2 [Limulus polyphemus]|uniref:Uncharacterized protein LOC111086829 isoform X2 n=1 Tax=Limulus polyphemus TaxID=6850 RepID=A0ABM1STQ7_LIMPO|nr:uncharacterized protein LOC111086829 isoform X2 [Limulus polyphemus]